MDKSVKTGKFSAVLAYLTIFGTIIAFTLNHEHKRPLASFHIRQALGIHLTFYGLGLLVSFFDSWLISAPFYLFIVSLWGYGFICAAQGQLRETPLLGKYFQKWFRTIA